MIKTPEEIIKDSLTFFKKDQSRKRREEVRKFLDYYSGSLTEQYIEDYFKSDAFQEIPHYNTNIVKKFINRMSKFIRLVQNEMSIKDTKFLPKLKMLV